MFAAIIWITFSGSFRLRGVAVFATGTRAKAVQSVASAFTTTVLNSGMKSEVMTVVM